MYYNLKLDQALLPLLARLDTIPAMSESKTITLKVPADVEAEFLAVAKHIGFASSAELLKTYMREVIISARIEQATASLRETIARGSNDLDELAVERKATTPLEQ